ncbi:hypothetical protein MASR1M90_14540 [Desulfovibrionales bacterium]
MTKLPTPTHPNSALTKAALDTIKKDTPVFPCDINKRPLTAHGFKDASTDPETVRRMFSRQDVAGIGIPTGMASGLVVLDRDRKNGVDGIATCQALEQTLGPLPETLQQRTGSGGDQLFFKYPEGAEIPCSAGKLGRGLDVRGEGGYVVVAPSRNEAGQYEWRNSLSPAQLPRAWIEHLARPARTEQAGHALTVTASQSTPYGKAALEKECQAVANEPAGSRNARLNQASFAAGQLAAGGEVVEGEARAALKQAAESCGLNERETQRTIESGIESGKQQPRSASATAKDFDSFKLTISEPDATWPAPEPLTAKVEPLPYPIQVLPDIVRDAVLEVQSFVQAPVEGAQQPTEGVWSDFVPFDQRPPDLPRGIVPGIAATFSEAVADAVQAPRELAYLNALGVVGLALQKKVVVRVKPDYAESVNLYAITASEPGERKSAVVEACKAPVVAWERAAQDQMRDVIREAVSVRRTMEKIIEKSRSKAANAKDPEARKRACLEIAQMERELPDVPALPRMLVDDCTPEAMAEILGGNGESLGLLEAEGGILDTWAGRYSAGVPNLDLILKAYSGEPVSVDRKNKEPIRLRSPQLTVVLTPQPSVLIDAGSNRAFMSRGLIGRCLLCMPSPLVGYRDSSRTMSAGTARQWHHFITTLLDIPQQDQPHEITLSADAYSAWVEFSNEVEKAQRPGGELEYVRPWASKSTGHVIRIAGLFHMSAGADAIRNPIDLETMQRAMAFIAWASKHARYCFGCFGHDPGQECAQRALEWVRREKLESVTARAIFQALKGKYSTMKLVRPGIDVLVDRGALIPTDRDARPGRPSETYAVNPAVHGGDGHVS